MRRVLIIVLPWLLTLGFFLAWRDAHRWMVAYKAMNEQSQQFFYSAVDERNACRSQLAELTTDQGGGPAIVAQLLRQMRREDQQLEHEQREQDTSDRLQALEQRLDCEQRNRQFSQRIICR